MLLGIEPGISYSPRSANRSAKELVINGIYVGADIDVQNGTYLNSIIPVLFPPINNLLHRYFGRVGTQKKIK